MYERIKGFREDNDFTQMDMAKMLHVSQSTYSDYELGKINIPVEVLKKLAQFFHTSIDYLLEMTDDPNPYTPRK